MAGLLQEQMQPQAQPQEQAQPDQSGEQGKYEKLVTMMLEFLYSEQGVQAVKQGLQMPGSPSQNIGTIVGRLIQKAWMDVKEQGATLNPMMIVQATMELSQAVTEMASESGMISDDQQKQVGKEGFYTAMEIAGRDTPKELFAEGEREQFAQILQLIDQLDAGGQQEGPQQGEVM
jgi:hypothetical protein